MRVSSLSSRYIVIAMLFGMVFGIVTTTSADVSESVPDDNSGEDSSHSEEINKDQGQPKESDRSSEEKTSGKDEEVNNDLEQSETSERSSEEKTSGKNEEVDRDLEQSETSDRSNEEEVRGEDEEVNRDLEQSETSGRLSEEKTNSEKREDPDAWGSSDDDKVGWGEAGDDTVTPAENDGGEIGFNDTESDSIGFADTFIEKDESETIFAETAPEETSKSSSWRISGFLRSDLGLWVDRIHTNGFAKARQSLDLSARYKIKNFSVVASGHGEYDFAYLHRREDYDSATLEAYEYLIDIRDTYVRGTTKYFDITLGKQIVAWGQGDMMTLVDVACPRDLREPGITDLDDTRLPVLSSRVGLFLGNHRIEAMVTHEAFFGYRPPPFGDYSPLPAAIPRDVKDLLKNTPVWYKDKQSRFDLKNQQYLGRWMYKGPGLDLELYFASILDNRGVILFDSVELLSDVINSNRVEIVLDHPRYTMIGHSGALPLGSWLFKWELGADFDRAFNVVASPDMPLQLEIERASLIGGFVGVAYTGFQNTSISLEFKKSFLFEEFPTMLFDVEAPTLGLRYYRNLFREDLRLDFTLLIYGFRIEYGWLGRCLIEHIIRDGLRVSTGYIAYYPGYGFGILSGMVDNNRFYVQLRWDFSIL